MDNRYKNITTEENHKKLLDSGMFFEFHPELTGDWQKDEFTILNKEIKDITSKILEETMNKKENTNNDFKSRLEAEKAELTEKMEKLRAFVSSEAFTKIDPVQMTLLNIQIKAMETYSQCLLERIVRL